MKTLTLAFFLVTFPVLLFSQNLQKKTKAVALNQNELKAYDLVKSAYTACENQKYDDGINFATSAIDVEKNYADAYYIRGECEYYSNKNDDALNDYNMAIKLYPKIPAYFDSRANLEEYHFDKQQALADYTTAIKLESLKKGKNQSSLGNYYEHRALFKFELLDYDGAMEDCNKAILYWPELYLSYSLKADIDLKNQNFMDALKDSNKAIELNPAGTDYSPYYTRGMTEVKLNRLQNACDDFYRAKQLSDDYKIISAIRQYCNN